MYISLIFHKVMQGRIYVVVGYVIITLGDSPSVCSSTTILQSPPKSLFTMPSALLCSSMDVRAGHSYRRHVKALEAHHIKCLQSILGVRWWHKVPHAEIWRKAYLECTESWIMQRQLHWLGHVIRMPSYHLLRHLLYGALQQGQRSAGGQKKCFSIHIKDTLKKCGIPLEQLEVLASDRDTWRTTCNQGLTIFRSNYAADAESGRARRHAASTSSFGATCHICGRVCASDFGLRSHLQSHTRLTSSTASSS